MIKNIDVEIKISPEDLAEIFSNLDELEMARFFNSVAENFYDWDSPFEFQLSAIEESKELTDKAKSVMKAIGEFSN